MQKLYIYIVEDNPLIALALREIISNMGHTVCGTASNYTKAVTDLGTMSVDLVITDIMLQGKENGIDLAQYINHHLHIPFIFQSSVTSADILTQANQTCPNAFLPKPVNKLAMIEAIAKIAA
ncbi:response regulator [Mucilaginibacter phyllosphaerae]|uniref:Response regulator n=1 Tax=Mucilaginibacter phyllosphaerae TaxID=1812349 RepID=A0A4Y8AF17_9SPHI|nr:response regulator [Mucilaginibacter phyllosphaerae]MBB3969020.1 DNA-binding NarL/FixJ family response regulator [Mucilaginibacter phyllosphaerae]TEW67364.1 response regulator [Mucilaginibacter phyllosphaerae]GGH23730.1 response regulator [Mucilaginibacter phyllosphaerae]